MNILNIPPSAVVVNQTVISAFVFPRSKFHRSPNKMSRSKKSAVPRTKPDKSANALSPEPTPTQGTRLLPLVLRREGFSDEIFYAPECAACGKPILDFRGANISVVNEAFRDEVAVGKVDTADAFEIVSDGAWAFHKECDQTGRAPWVTSHCVFRNDQRREFEKRGGL
jgi:hypothetical protein